MNTPPEILGVLDRLRQHIRRYVLIEGLALVVALLGAMFWLSYGADVAWFRISRLELPLWFRRVVLIGAIILFCLGVCSWILFRFLRSFREKALALVLEKRFPELDDKLVTAVEYATEPRPAVRGIGGAMLTQTINDAAKQVQSLDLKSVFDSAPMRRSLLLAVVALVSVVGFGVTNATALGRWYNAYIVGSEGYWDPFRQSKMTIQILAQPGDRLREFDADFSYKHPRGADLTVVVTANEGKSVPDAVSLLYWAQGSGGSRRGTDSMAQVGERQFRHTIGRVIDPHQLRVIGGDYTNRELFRIEIVDPPRVDRIRLQCDYPTYTGMNGHDGAQLVEVQGSRVALPMETSFTLLAEANKSLTGLTVRSERFSLEVGFQQEGDVLTPLEGTLTLHSVDATVSRTLTVPAESIGAMLSGDHKTLQLPMSMSSQSGAQLDALVAEDSTVSSLAISAANPFPLPADTRIQIYLEDSDRILSSDPAVVTINGIVDQPPVIETRLVGIGPLITRLAQIPVAGKMTDDYGIAHVEFRYRVGDEVEERLAPLKRPPSTEIGSQATEFLLDDGIKETAFDDASLKTEKLDVLKLQSERTPDGALPPQLEEGQKVFLYLRVRDGDDQNGPHETDGQGYEFTVVSEAELLTALADKELDMRTHVEQIRSEIDQVRSDILRHRREYTEGEAIRTQLRDNPEDAKLMESLRELTVSVQAAADRGIHMIRKDHSETLGIEAQFRGILAEMRNNRVDNESASRRLIEGIINPLHIITSTGYPEADEQMNLFSLAMQRGQNPVPAIDQTVDRLDQLLSRLDGILALMQQRRGYNAVIKELQEILDRQKKVLEATEKERERSVIDDLFK